MDHGLLTGGNKLSTQLDFSQWGSITVHEDIFPSAQVIQFHPSNRSNLYDMHDALVRWGKINDRDIGILLNSAKDWPVPCAIVFPVETLKKKN